MGTNDGKLQKKKENIKSKILNETKITFSKKQFRPTKNNYKKVLGLECNICV